MSNAAARLAPSSACRSHAVRGHAAVGRGGGDDDGVEVLGAHAGARQRHAAGLGGELGERLVGARHPALADAGALDDPLVGGVERLLRSSLVTIPSGTATPRPRKAAIGARLMRCARRWPRTRRRCAGSGPAWTDWTATRMAFLIALGADAAVADDADAPHAEQRRAAVLGVVEDAEDLAHVVALEDLGRVALDQPHDQARHRLVELEHDVADEAVARPRRRCGRASRARRRCRGPRCCRRS